MRRSSTSSSERPPWAGIWAAIVVIAIDLLLFSSWGPWKALYAHVSGDGPSRQRHRTGSGAAASAGRRAGRHGAGGRGGQQSRPGRLPVRFGERAERGPLPFHVARLGARRHERLRDSLAGRRVGGLPAGRGGAAALGVRHPPAAGAPRRRLLRELLRGGRPRVGRGRDVRLRGARRVLPPGACDRARRLPLPQGRRLGRRPDTARLSDGGEPSGAGASRAALRLPLSRGRAQPARRAPAPAAHRGAGAVLLGRGSGRLAAGGASVSAASPGAPTPRSR